MKMIFRNRLDPDNPLVAVIRSLLLGSLGFTGLTPTVSAGATGDLYVATTGNDSNPGTSGSPFRTIQAAANIANPGNTIWVNDGTYIDDDSNSVVVSVSRSGSSGSPITFRAVNKWGAKLNGQSNVTGHGWSISGSWVVVRDFEIYGMGAVGGDAFELAGDNITIYGNHIHDIGRQCDDQPYGLDAILIDQGADNILIDSNLIHDIGRFSPGESGCNPSQTYYQNNDHGVYIDGSTNVTVINNIFYNHQHGWAVHIYPNASSNIKILNNTFVYPNTYRVGHIVLASPITTIDIANNIFYDPTTAGIRYAGGTITGGTVRNNLTYDGVSLWNDTNSTTTVSGITKSGNIDNTDPAFTNAASRDFTLQVGSPGINAGLTLSDVTKDYAGVSRPVGGVYDIGAYEQ